MTEGLLLVRATGQVGRQVAYSSDLGRLLRVDGERRRESPGQRRQQEAAAVHGGHLFDDLIRAQQQRGRDR